MDIRAVARVLAASGAVSLLALSEREWRSRFPAWADKAGQRAALVLRAPPGLRPGRARARRLGQRVLPRHLAAAQPGHPASASNAIATLRFGGISQPWLKDLAKRWTRWRISAGISMSACYQGIRAVTRFSAFAARAGVQGPPPGGPRPAGTLPGRLHRELAGNTREQQAASGS